jgi:hypothetical protein
MIAKRCAEGFRAAREGGSVVTLKQAVVAVCFLAVMTVGANAATPLASLAFDTTGSTQSFTYDGWTVSLASCTYSDPAAFSGTSSCNAGTSGSPLNGDQIQLVSTSRGLSLVLANSNSSQSVITIADTTSGVNATAYVGDITYSLQVSAGTNPTPKNFTSVSAAVSGVSTASTSPYSVVSSTPYTVGGPKNPLTFVSDGLTVKYGSNPATTETGSFNAATGATTVAPFSPQTGITITEDLDLTVQPGQRLVLNNNPTYAPEPATIALMAPALLAMVKARKSRRRKE